MTMSARASPLVGRNVNRRAGSEADRLVVSRPHEYRVYLDGWVVARVLAVERRDDSPSSARATQPPAARSPSLQWRGGPSGSDLAESSSWQAKDGGH
eukprot:3343520-Rhodomonas_salina.3